jgi:hypothetical protein
VGEYCDGYTYEDGSYDHCVSVTVLGFGGTQCKPRLPTRPRQPGRPALPWQPSLPCPFYM